jgi:hypothetical protein
MSTKFNTASTKAQSLIKDEIKPENKKDIKSISKIKDKLEEHENMKFVLFAITGGLVGLALYFSN